MKDLTNVNLNDTQQLIVEVTKIIAGIKSLVAILIQNEQPQSWEVIMNYLDVMNNLILQAEDCCEQLAFIFKLKQTAEISD